MPATLKRRRGREFTDTLANSMRMPKFDCAAYIAAAAPPINTFMPPPRHARDYRGCEDDNFLRFYLFDS